MSQPRKGKPHLFWDSFEKRWVLSYESERRIDVLTSDHPLPDAIRWFEKIITQQRRSSLIYHNETRNAFSGWLVHGCE